MCVLVCLSLSLSTCQPEHFRTASGKPLIVATTTFVADVVRNLATNNVELLALMGAGTDPHLFKPALQDVKKLYEADIVVASGLHLEGKMAEILAKVARTKPVIFLSDGVPRDKIRYPAGLASAPDPHFWFAVPLWRAGALYGARRLQHLLPKDSVTIGVNALRFGAALAELDSSLRAEINKTDTGRRWLVTSHDAFAYFGQTYNVRVKTLQGISTVSEFGIRDVSNLVTFLIDHRIHTIYPETSMPLQALEALQEGCKERGFATRLGKPLYSDALDRPGSSAGTYIGMMRYNVSTIARGFDQNK